jgi:ribonuclease P protein component
VSADEPRSNGSDTDGHESTLESSAPRTKAQGAAKQAGKPNAFPATRRLKRRADFLRIQSSSIRVSTAHFAWLYAFHLPDAKATCCRLGLVVSKKVGNAVARNRVKRLVREAFRLQPNAFREDADLVVIAPLRPLPARPKLAGLHAARGIDDCSAPHPARPALPGDAVEADPLHRGSGLSVRAVVLALRGHVPRATWSAPRRLAFREAPV